MPHHQSPIDSVDLEELLEQAILELAKAKANTEISRKSESENVKLLESVVNKLQHIKGKRLRDSDIIH